MTNNQLCSVLCVLGMVATTISMGLMFFGVTAAWIAAAAGIVTTTVGMISFD